jgi:hypothetical protein
VVVLDKGVPEVIPAFRESIPPTPIFTATQAGLPQGLRYAQKTDFAPRVGFAWRATSDGKTVIRGGFGRFIETTLGQLVSGAWGVQSSDVAQFTNTIANGKAQLSFPYPFPADLAQPGSQAFQYSYSIHYKDPYVQQWNLTIERDLGFQTGLRVSYDGSHGSDLAYFNDLTQVQANTIGYAKAKVNSPYPIWSAIGFDDFIRRVGVQVLGVDERLAFGDWLELPAETADDEPRIDNGRPRNPPLLDGDA